MGTPEGPKIPQDDGIPEWKKGIKKPSDRNPLGEIVSVSPSQFRQEADAYRVDMATRSIVGEEEVNKGFLDRVLRGDFSAIHEITILSEEVAEKLATSNLPVLNFGSAKDIPVNIAKILAKYNGNMSFPNLKSISVESMRLLAGREKGTLSFYHLSLERCEKEIWTILAEYEDRTGKELVFKDNRAREAIDLAKNRLL